VKSKGHGEESAVDGKIDPGDETAGGGAREEYCGADQLRGLTKATHGGAAKDRFGTRGWLAALVKKEAAILLGWEEAGGERIDADAAGRPFAGEELAEVEDSGLSGGVGDNAAEWQVGGDTGDIDDTAAPALAHSGAKFLAWEESATHEIEVETRHPVGGGDFLEGVVGSDGDRGIVAAGGADENAGGPEAALDGLVGLGETARACGVADEKSSGAAGIANTGGAGFAAIGAAAQDGNEGAGAGEALGECADEDARAADNDGNFAG